MAPRYAPAAAEKMNNPRDLLDPIISMITQFGPILVITLAIFIILLRPVSKTSHIYIAFFATLIAFFITIQGSFGYAGESPLGSPSPLKDLWESRGAPLDPTIENSEGGAYSGPLTQLPWILMDTTLGRGEPYGLDPRFFGANLSDILSNGTLWVPGGALGAPAMGANGAEILGLKGDNLSELSFGMIKENTY